MSKLIMLSGVPGSGKSTNSEKIAQKEQAVILSSDKIYEELTGDFTHKESNLGKIFNVLYDRARKHLKQNENVIIDSTNISSKKRKDVLQQFKNAKEKELYQFITPFETCVERDKQRNRTVGYGVIREMFLRIFLPFENEGFDKIHYVVDPSYKELLNGMIAEQFENCLNGNYSHDELFNRLSVIPYFKSIYNLPQDSTYHTFSVSRHTYYVLDYVNQYYQEDDKLAMQYVAIFHDIGKHLAKNFKENARYANFIGHENVSAQIAFGILHYLGYKEEFVKKVAKLVLLHMRFPRNDATEKAIEKFRQSVDQNTYNQLAFFRMADESAK